MSKAVLIVNLGTPDSPNPKDVKKYLHEFLLDKRVIDKNWLLRQLLVRGIIVPNRYKESAKSYQAIWTDKGSPLLAYSKKLTAFLDEKLIDAKVYLAMRYQNPSLQSVIKQLHDENIQELIILPLFPQYASATTGSIYQRVMEIMKSFEYFPKLTFIPHFFDKNWFIDAFASNLSDFSYSEFDHILFSFHGLPKRQLKKINPNCCQEENLCCSKVGKENYHCYAAQCFACAREIAKKSQIPVCFYTVCFQSRLGKDPWIEPFTSSVIENLAKKGMKNLLVVCPSFVADCLETLYEIEVEYQELFQSLGGERIKLVKSLNDNPIWFKGVYNELAAMIN